MRRTVSNQSTLVLVLVALAHNFRAVLCGPSKWDRRLRVRRRRHILSTGWVTMINGLLSGIVGGVIVESFSQVHG